MKEMSLTWSKSGLSILRNSDLSLHMIVAVCSMLCNKDTSPNISPANISATVCTWSGTGRADGMKCFGEMKMKGDLKSSLSSPYNQHHSSISGTAEQGRLRGYSPPPPLKNFPAILIFSLSKGVSYPALKIIDSRWLHVATAWIIENWDDVAVKGKSLKSY